MVRIALWALRIYLLILLSLIGLKFARVFSGSQKQEARSPLPRQSRPTHRPQQPGGRGVSSARKLGAAAS